MAKRAAATYVYCLINSAERPSLTRVPAGLPGTGPVRVLDLGPNETLRLVVADAPLSRYGEEAIQRGLSNLDWVSRAAVAHEAVIEFFIDVDAVLPMKLFTLFTSDERALAHMRADRPRIAALVKWLAKHHEWGVRVVLDRDRAVRMPRGAAKTAAGAATGTAYLAHKKAQRDAARELAERARETVAAVYDRLALRARASKR